jgi:phage terminase small subunit
MTSPVSIDGLDPMMRAFAEHYAQGFTQTQSAKRAGYANPSSSGASLLQNPKVLAMIEELRTVYAEAAGTDRTAFIDGLKEAIDMARTMSDPQTMIIGWRELGKACGYYEPEKKELSVTVRGNVRLDQLKTMSDDELLKLIEQQPAIEGQAERIPE